MFSQVLDKLCLSQNTCTGWTPEHETEIDSLSCGNSCNVSTTCSRKLMLFFMLMMLFFSIVLFCILCCLLCSCFQSFCCPRLVFFLGLDTNTSMLSFITIFVILHHEFFTTASEDGEEIDVRVEVCHSSDKLLDLEEFVPFVLLIEVVSKQDLLTVIGHSMTCEELNNQSFLWFFGVTCFRSAVAHNELELFLPLLDGRLMVRKFVEFLHFLSLSIVEAVVVHEVVSCFAASPPTHLHMLIWFALHRRNIHTFIIFQELLLDSLLVFWQGEQVKVVRHHSEEIQAVVDSLCCIIDDSREVAHPLFGTGLHKLLEHLTFKLHLGLLELLERSSTFGSSGDTLSNLSSLLSNGFANCLKVVIPNFIKP